MDYEEIEKEELETLKENELEKVGNIYLTKYQKKVLDEYHVPYEKVSNTKELLFLLSDIVDDREYDELEEVARQIDEFSYYHETLQ